MSISALIVDDEPWARTRLTSLLSSEPDFQVPRTCTNADEAIEAITELHPQVVFLDVQMPGLDGFDVIQTIGLDAMPVVVFVTAYQQHAIKAFDAGALDYLLKPFDEDRFRVAIERVRKHVRTPQAHARHMTHVLEHIRHEGRFLRRLVVNSAGKIVILNVQSIDWCEASGNYVTVHVGREQYLVRETLTALSEKLDPEQFVRLHRSSLINIERLREVMPWSRGEQIAVLHDGTQLTIGRAFRQKLVALLTNAVS